MRKSERQTTDEDARRLFVQAGYCVLSMVTPEGDPYAVPLSFVLEDDTIYIHAAAGVGRKFECLEKHPRASAVVVGDVETIPGRFSTLYESAIASGTVRIIADEAERQMALNALVAKYDAEHAEAGARYARAASAETDVYALDIVELTGKARRRK